jgi:hypothetical protein
MKILRLEKFDPPITCQNGDKMTLSVNEKVVHSESISEMKIISCWALVSIGDSLGYFIGGDDLEEELRNDSK